MDNKQIGQNHLSEKTNKKSKLIGILCIAVFLIILIVVFIFVGEPMIKFAKEPERFRSWVNELGVWGRLAFVGMMALQIIVAVIPGEPLEIVAGYAFGVFEGTLLCMLGALVGGVAVFLFVRYFGVKIIDIFVSHEKISQLKFLNTKKKLTLLTTIVFLIPGTPKDVLTYFVGLTPMKITTWMLITSLARFPSIITSTMGGNALGTKEYITAAFIFAATIIISAAGLLIYKRISSKKHPNEKEEDSQPASTCLDSDSNVQPAESSSKYLNPTQSKTNADAQGLTSTTSSLDEDGSNID